MWVVVAIVWGIFLVGTLRRIRRRTDRSFRRPAMGSYRPLAELRDDVSESAVAQGDGTAVLSREISPR